MPGAAAPLCRVPQRPSAGCRSAPLPGTAAPGDRAAAKVRQAAARPLLAAGGSEKAAVLRQWPPLAAKHRR